MRRAAKRDANEPEIIEALEDARCRVWQLSQEGMPDLLIVPPPPDWYEDIDTMSRRELVAAIDELLEGRVVLQEVKNGEWRGKLTPAQHENLINGLPFQVVQDKWEALHALGINQEAT